MGISTASLSGSPLDFKACEAARLRHLTEAKFGLLRFSHAARLWLAEHRSNISEPTHRSYQDHLRWLTRAFEDLPLAEIHIGHVEEYQKWRQKPRYDEKAKRTLRAGYSPINHEVNTLAQILDRAGLWTEIKKFYRPLHQPKTRGCALEPEEQEALFCAASSNPRWRVAYLCSLITANTSAGPKEIRYLHLSDIDLNRRGGDGEPLPTLTIRDGLKNEHRDRTVYLVPTAVMAFKLLLTRARRLGCQDPEHFLLPHRAHRRGEPADPNRPMGSWKRAFRAMCAKAGLPHLRPYDLRHLIITKLMEDPNVSDQTVEEIVGHKPNSDMKKHYSHIRMHRKRQALLAAEAKAPTVQLGLAFMSESPLSPRAGSLREEVLVMPPKLAKKKPAGANCWEWEDEETL
jgi:integrase